MFTKSINEDVLCKIFGQMDIQPVFNGYTASKDISYAITYNSIEYTLETLQTRISEQHPNTLACFSEKVLHHDMIS